MPVTGAVPAVLETSLRWCNDAAVESSKERVRYESYIFNRSIKTNKKGPRTRPAAPAVSQNRRCTSWRFQIAPPALKGLFYWSLERRGGRHDPFFFFKRIMHKNYIFYFLYSISMKEEKQRAAHRCLCQSRERSLIFYFFAFLKFYS